MQSNFTTKLLPTYYYLEHFEFLLTFVQQHYVQLLCAAEINFIKKFKALSFPARCLYVRLINRNNYFYKAAQLDYPEIASIEAALQELLASTFVIQLNKALIVDNALLLNIFTKNELVTFIKQKQLAFNQASIKNVLIKNLIENIAPSELITLIEKKHFLIAPTCLTELQMLRFLFFGSLQTDMTRFVVKDLGHLTPPTFSQNSFTARFTTRKAAEDCLIVQQAYQTLRSFEGSALDSYHWFKAWHNLHPDLHSQAEASFGKLVLRLGKWLEKSQLYQEALDIYRLTQQTPSLERQIRLLAKLGDTEKAKSLCAQLLQHASNADELYFAKDFCLKLVSVAQKKSTTTYLKRAKIIELLPDKINSPEQSVITYLHQQGIQAFYTENYFWRGLFGLLFWDIVFDASLNTIHHPLQTAPSDLYQPSFYQTRQTALESRIELLQDKSACLAELQTAYTTYHGIANPMVSWHESLWDTINCCYHFIPADKLGTVLLKMAKDWRNNSCGFPDLFTWSDKNYTFIEVKSPNDQLSAQQLNWLEDFHSIGINAEVVRIKWIDN